MVATATRPPRARRPKTYTPEEFEAIENAVAYELREDGTLEQRHMGWESELVAANVTFLLRQHDRADQRGLIANGGTGLQVFPGRPRRIPRADVTYVRRDRMPSGRPARGYMQIPPDLAVEVISPGDKAGEVRAKVHEYLVGGVRLVWVVYPETRSVTVSRADGSADEFGSEDTLSGEDVVPGFSVKVSELFEGI